MGHFLYNPAVIVAYRLDPRFNGELVNSGNWHDIIEEEIIRISGEDNEVQVLYKLSEYIGRRRGFAKKHLWNLLKSRYHYLVQLQLKFYQFRLLQQQVKEIGLHIILFIPNCELEWLLIEQKN